MGGRGERGRGRGREQERNIEKESSTYYLIWDQKPMTAGILFSASGSEGTLTFSSIAMGPFSGLKFQVSL